MRRMIDFLPWLLLTIGGAAVFIGLAEGSALELPFPDEPPPVVLAAHRARTHRADVAAMLGAAAVLSAAPWLLARRLRRSMRPDPPV